MQTNNSDPGLFHVNFDQYSYMNYINDNCLNYLGVKEESHFNRFFIDYFQRYADKYYIPQDEQEIIAQKIANSNVPDKPFFIADFNIFVNCELRRHRWVAALSENCFKFPKKNLEFVSFGCDCEHDYNQKYSNFLNSLRTTYHIFTTIRYKIPWLKKYILNKKYGTYDVLELMKRLDILCVKDYTINYSMSFIDKYRTNKEQSIIIYNPSLPKIILDRILFHEMAHHILGHINKENKEHCFPLGWNLTNSYVEKEANMFADMMFFKPSYLINCLAKNNLNEDYLLNELLDRDLFYLCNLFPRTTGKKCDNFFLSNDIRSFCRLMINSFVESTLSVYFLLVNNIFNLFMDSPKSILSKYYGILFSTIYKLSKLYPEKFACFSPLVS